MYLLFTDIFLYPLKQKYPSQEFVTADDRVGWPQVFVFSQRDTNFPNRSYPGHDHGDSMLHSTVFESRKAMCESLKKCHIAHVTLLVTQGTDFVLCNFPRQTILSVSKALWFNHNAYGEAHKKNEG